MNRVLAELYGTVSHDQLAKIADEEAEVSQDNFDIDSMSAADLLALLGSEDEEASEEATADVAAEDTPVEEAGEVKVALEDDATMEYDTLGRLMAHQVYSELETPDQEKVAEVSQAERIRQHLIAKLSN